MLEHARPMPNPSLNGIARVNEHGLVLLIAGDEIRAPWRAVNGIGAAVATRHEIHHFVLTLEIDTDGSARLFIVLETEPVWSKLVDQLHLWLPSVPPFEQWGAALAADPKVIELYERQALG